MSSGIALVIAVLAKASLALMLFVLGLFAGCILALKWFHATDCSRNVIKQKIVVGLKAGCIATLAYDLSRLLVVKLCNFPISPFKAFPLFGHLILGENASQAAVYIAGTAYHFVNGMLFTVAYCFAFGGRHWLYGVLWALGLEGAMLALYPTWLDLGKVMQEFTIMSMTGHVVYGSVLGVLCQKWLKAGGKKQTISEDRSSG